MKKHIVTGALLALLTIFGALAIACGGGDDDNGDAGDEPTTAATEASSDGDATATGDASDGGGIDFGDGTASVTVGDMSFEFDMAADFTVCRDVFGAIQLSGPSADGLAIKVEGWIPPTDWATYDDDRYDPPSIAVEDDVADTIWVADQEFAATNGLEGSSQIDSYELDGLTASGSATFVNRRAVERSQTVEAMQGTFQISCSE